MPKLLFFFFLVFPLVIIAQIKPDEQLFNQIVQAENQYHKKLLLSNKSLAGLNYDMKYQRLCWEINPKEYFIKGSITTYFKPVVASMPEISFDMANELTCDSVVYHGQHLSSNHFAGDLTINLPTSIALGQLDSITIFYQGAPPQNGSGSFMRGTHTNDSIIWTLSEPYGAMDWMPCKQALTDKIDSIDVYITCPSQYKAASNGKLVSEEITGTNKLAHWKHRHPIATYLIALAVTNYASYSDWVHYPGTDSLEVLNYVYPEDMAEARQGTVNTEALVHLYNQYFIQYPFNDEKYGHAECGFSGGMEHQTMTFCGSFGYELIAHELAHQWFGDYITCGNWHDIWLNEGFATFVTGWSYEKMFDGYWWPTWKTNQINYITSHPDGSVYCDDTTSIDRVFDGRLSYSKGAMILHMLRWELGDSAFFSAVRNYLTDPALINGFAYTSNIIHHFETTSGRSLSEYFSDWFYGQGFPMYDIHWSQDNNGLVTLLINQSQSHASVSFFEMHLPIKFIGATQDTICRILNNVDAQTISFPLNFAVQNIQFDPNQWIVTKNPVIQHVDELYSEKDFTVLPNPVHDFIFVQTNKSKNILKIELFDMNGKNLASINSSAKDADFKINISGFSAGKYVLNIHTDKNTIRKVFIKE